MTPLRPTALTALLTTMVLLAMNHSWAGVGEAAVVTLSFPPGARATGMGEAFTGLSDDINATFFNPAGLGQPPLANSWHSFLEKNQATFSVVASRKKKAFELRETIWAGSNKGLLRYNSRAWESFERHLIEKDETLESIARRYVDGADEKTIAAAVRTLRTENKIGLTHYANIVTLLSNSLKPTGTSNSGAVSAATPVIVQTRSSKDSIVPVSLPVDTDTSEIALDDSIKQTDSLFVASKSDTGKPVLPAPAATTPPVTAAELATQIISLPGYDQTSVKIYSLIAGKVDSAQTDKIVAGIAAILAEPDVELKDLVELKIPFSIALSDSVNTMIVDENDQLWVGTDRGLFRYSGTSWKQYTVLDGLPVNKVTALAMSATGIIAVGTTDGVGLVDGDIVKPYAAKNAMPDPSVTALSFGKDSTLFVGTRKGVARFNGTSWTLYDSTSGLLSTAVSALSFDSEDKLWIGGENGITLWDEATWKRYKFPDSHVYCFAEYHAGRMWIGTNKGAIVYQAGKTNTDENGKVIQESPEWKVYHSKNALIGDRITSVAVYGKDVWVATENGINQYNNAERQVLFFWEPLLPAFGIKDLWHTYFAIVWPTEDWGTVGFHLNFINMGVNEWTNELGSIIGRARSYEFVAGLAYGLALKEDLSLGVNLKYVHSALAPGIQGGEGVGRTFAIDAAILKRNLLFKGFDLGFNMQNMGPSIWYIGPDQRDPIPYTWRLGLAYRAIRTPVNDLSLALDLYREIVHSNGSGKPDPFYTAIYTDLLHDTETNFKEQLQEIQMSMGLEWWYVNFLALRTGLLFDYQGERYEWTFGLGLKYGTLNVDWSYIVAPEGFMKGLLQKINPAKEGATGARDGQWRISLITRF